MITIFVIFFILAIVIAFIIALAFMHQVRTPLARLRQNSSFDNIVVGESNYQSALKSLFSRYDTGFEFTAILTPEHANTHDKNAVNVTINNAIVGYLPREIAASYRSTIGVRKSYCLAKLSGGFETEGERAHIGVEINAHVPFEFS